MLRFTSKIKAIILALLTVSAFALVGCDSQADTVSDNLSKDADAYKIYRRLVFINAITDKYLLQVEGYCALGNKDPQYEVSFTCKVGADKYIKDFVRISDNVTYTVEQLAAVPVDPFHYKVVFRPETIIPDIDFQTSG